MAKRIVFFDVDHTLYDPEQRVIPQSAIDSIQALHAHPDILVGIATGRAFFMLDLIQDITPFVDVFVTVNGQVIYAHDQLIENDPMDRQTLTVLKEVFRKHALNYGFIGLHTQGISQLTPHAQGMFEEANMPLPVEDPDFDLTHAVYQMWAFADETMLKTLQKELPEHQLVPWLSDGFDVIHSVKSKKDGLFKVLEHFDIALDHCLCFGDGDNDIAMLEAIPQSVAMGNALPHVKAKAHYVTEPLHENGIANALKRLGWL